MVGGREGGVEILREVWKDSGIPESVHRERLLQTSVEVSQ
jgi:hypothetical protein